MKAIRDKNITNSIDWPDLWHKFRCNVGTIYIASEILPTLQALGLEECGNVFAFKSANTYSDRRGYRDITRLDWKKETLYLKRYVHLRRKEYAQSWLTPFCYRSHAHTEFRNYQILHSLGVNTAIPLAWGETQKKWTASRSFIITRNVNAVTLDQYLIGCKQVNIRRALIANIAGLVRKLHAAGYYYLDWKAKHIYIKNDDIILLDVERMKKFPLLMPKNFFILKELGNLDKSLPTECITNSEHLRFIKTYCNSERIGNRERQWILRMHKRRYAISLGKKWYLRMWKKWCIYFKNLFTC